MARTKVGTPDPGRLDELGREVPDPTRLSLPSGFKRPETLAEQVQRLVRVQVSREAENAGYETFEESEDFELPDDPDDPTTPYEEYFDPTLGRGITAQEFRDNFEVYKQRYLEADERAYNEMVVSDALRRVPGQPATPPAPAAPSAPSGAKNPPSEE